MRARRLIAGVVAIILLGVWTQARHLVADDRLVPDMWPWVWAFAIATCVVAAIHARSALAWAVAGATVATAAAARIPAVLHGDDTAVNASRAGFAAWLYLLIAWLVVCTWVLAAPSRRP